jgi:signal transduction histidine kinase
VSIVGKTLADVWGNDIFRGRIKENIDKCFSGATVKYEASFSVPQAGMRYFEVVFRPFPADEGEITHLLAETFDITDLKLSEKTAVQKEEEFRKFETNLPIGFMRCDPCGKILHTNRSFQMIMECDDVKGFCKNNLKSYYAEPFLFDIHLEQLKDNKPKSFGRVSLVTCRNNQITCRISAFLTNEESGNPGYIDFSFEDSSRELLLESRLLQAQKLETIGALAGGIAHDFNNILATISGYSELLKEDLPKASPSFENVKRILVAVSKAQSLTKQILTFSKHVEQEKVTVRVYEVLKETIGFIKSAAPPNVVVKSHFRNKSATVYADPTQLFRVFLNLLTNAIQSIEERSGKISVTLGIVEGKKVRKILNKDIVPDEYVLVVFKDSGKGMDPSLLRRIFEPFFTTREVGKGSGLGLSVVHGIVTEMGGEILVSSEKEKGSEFQLYLPVSKEFSIPPDMSGRKRRILFISGNKHESRILSLALISTGYELIHSSDQNHLFRIISKPETSPDLIIYMSDNEFINAGELIDFLGSREKRIPCILINEENQEMNEEKLLNSGIVSQQLIKPVSLKEIRNAIRLSIG